MRWPWRRRPAAAVEAIGFDALIDVPAGAVAAAVRAGVAALPGAGWISVEPAGAVSIALFERGTSRAGVGPGWETLRRQVQAVVDAALAGPAPEWGAAAAAAAGFAEPAAAGLEAGELRQNGAMPAALAQLAALAALHRPEPPPSPPPLPSPPPPPPLPLPAPQADAAPADAETVRLARLLGLVLPVEASATAAAAVRRFGSYAAVLAAPEAELRRVPGLGTHCVAAIKLVHAAAIRLARAGVAAQPVLERREQLADYLAAALARERVEQFRVLFLDEHGMLRADEVQARGTVNHTPVYPREVVRRALALGAASLILVHNHPSGDPTPSREDIDMTAQVRDAAAVMKIALRDHVIVGNGRWLSFRDEGLLR